MSNLKNIESQCQHIKNELKPFYGNDIKIDEAIDSINDSADVILDNAVDQESDINEKDKKIKELEDEINDLENEDKSELEFTPNCEYHFNSMSGKMSLFSSSLGDDQILDTFSTLAQHIKSSELDRHLKNILLKYPAICKKLALPI